MTLYDEIYQWMGNECGCGGHWADCIREDDGCCADLNGEWVCIQDLMHRVYLIGKLVENINSLNADGLKLLVSTWAMTDTFEGSEGKILGDVEALVNLLKGGK